MYVISVIKHMSVLQLKSHNLKLKLNSVVCSPQVNYTDRVAASC
jgi:hypothetical protein